LRIEKTWAMPSKNTFSIPPIADLLHEELAKVDGLIIDPFANTNRIADVTNDLDPAHGCDYSLDALDFLRTFKDNEVSVVLYDPPYSPRQISECYTKLGHAVNMETTQASYWRKHKQEISRIVKPNGLCITCAWNSGGMGKKYGFEQYRILLVAHGGWHNDTIVTVERKKVDTTPSLF
jgi:hypothetical protein